MTVTDSQSAIYPRRRHHAGTATTGKLKGRQAVTIRIPEREYFGALQNAREIIGHALGFPISNSIVVRLAVHELADELHIAGLSRMRDLLNTAKQMISKRAQKKRGS
jgi:hypothetical protein